MLVIRVKWLACASFLRVIVLLLLYIPAKVGVVGGGGGFLILSTCILSVSAFFFVGALRLSLVFFFEVDASFFGTVVG